MVAVKMDTNKRNNEISFKNEVIQLFELTLTRTNPFPFDV